METNKQPEKIEPLWLERRFKTTIPLPYGIQDGDQANRVTKEMVNVYLEVKETRGIKGLKEELVERRHVITEYDEELETNTQKIKALLMELYPGDDEKSKLERQMFEMAARGIVGLASSPDENDPKLVELSDYQQTLLVERQRSIFNFSVLDNLIHQYITFGKESFESLYTKYQSGETLEEEKELARDERTDVFIRRRKITRELLPLEDEIPERYRGKGSLINLFLDVVKVETEKYDLENASEPSSIRKYFSRQIGKCPTEEKIYLIKEWAHGKK